MVALEYFCIWFFKVVNCGKPVLSEESSQKSKVTPDTILPF